MAVQCGEAEIVRMMVKTGADVNLDFANTTPLIRAVECVFPEVIETLIEAGADVNKIAKNGLTPLTSAFQLTRLNITTQERDVIIRMPKSAGAE